MLDKSIKYYDIIMKRDAGSYVPCFELPEGFRFASFQKGDEKHWADIETSVQEFDSEAKALAYFNKEFRMTKEMELRCFFIQNEMQEKIATFTVWWDYIGKRRVPKVHWVSVRPECQGLGLGKTLVCEGMRRFIEIEGDVDIYLHTQTWSYKAINIYSKFGFYITDERGLGGCENLDYNKALEIIKPYIR